MTPDFGSDYRQMIGLRLPGPVTNLQLPLAGNMR